MSTEPLPLGKQVRVDAFRNVGRRDNVVPLRERSDMAPAQEVPLRGEALLAALSPLLDEADGLRGDKARQQDTGNVRQLLEENAKLRHLAVRLSNLLGDLPERGT